MDSLLVLPRSKPRHERLFFTSAAGGLLLVTFVGFAPTYYLAGAFDAPALTPLVHLHGVVFTAWMLLFTTQTGLIAARRTDLHRLAGLAGAVLAVVIVVLGIIVAIESGRRGGGGPQRNQPVFLVFPFTNMLLFAVFCAAGVRARLRAGDHKRLMLLATLALAITPLARISKMLGMPFSPPAIGGMILADLFLAALLAFDVQTRGRLHPATLWAGGLFLVSQPLRVIIGHTEAWQAFARGLLA